MLPLALLCGCGADDENPSRESCDEVVVDADEISATPRDDVEAEVVALACSEGVVADQAKYELVSADLDAIRSLDPAMAAITHYDVPLFENPRLLVLAESIDIARDVQRGLYAPIRCLNEALGGEVGDGGLQGADDWFDVAFTGILDTTVLAELYSEVDGIRSAVGDALGGDGSRISVHVDGATREYLFDQRGGDCPAGCTTSHLWWWRVDGDGAPMLVADWGDGSSSTAPDEFDPTRFLCAKCGDGSLATTEIELECGDGRDDDCDGFVDCEDIDCNGVGPCAVEDCGNCSACFGELAECALDQCEDCESLDEGCEQCADERCSENIVECSGHMIAWR